MEYDETAGYMDADGEFQPYEEGEQPEETDDYEEEELSEDDIADEETTDDADQDDSDYQDEAEEDSSEPEYESYEEQEEQQIDYPDFVPDELIVPKFKSERAELNWYRDNYNKTFGIYQNDDFKHKLLDHYKDFLLSEEENVESLKAVESVFKNEPEIAIKVFGAEGLEKNGISSKLTDEEVGQIVNQEMIKYFGSNYAQKYDQSELIDPNSLSSKMLMKSQEIGRSIQEHQNYSEQLAQQYKPLSDEELQEELDKEYYANFQQEMSIDEYDEMIDEINNTDIGIMDLHKAIMFNEYMQEAYSRGIQDGRKNLVGDIKKASKPINPYSNVKRTNKNDEPFDIMANRRLPKFNF